MSPILQFFLNVTGTGYFCAFIIFFTRLSLCITLPFLSIYLVRDNIFSPTQIGVISSAALFTIGITGTVNGIFVDKYGSYAILICSLIGSALCYFAFSFSMHVFLLILLCNALIGWLTSCIHVCATSIAVNNIPDEKLPIAYGACLLTINLAIIFGPLIGAQLARTQSLIIFYTAGILFLLAAAVVLFVNKDYFKKKTTTESTNKWESFKIILNNKLFMLIISIRFFIFFISAQFETTLPQLIARTIPHPEILVSEIFLIWAIVSIVFQPIITSRADKYSVKKCGFAGCILFALVFIILALFPSKTMYLLGSVFLSFAELLTIPLSALLILRIAPKSLTASYNGFSSLSILGLFFGAILGGLGLQFIGSSETLLLVGLLSIMISIFYLISMPD